MTKYAVKTNLPPQFSSDILEKAFDAPRAAYTPYDLVNTHNELCGSAALLYLILCEKYYPGTKSKNGDTAISRIESHIRYLIQPGNEPSMRCGPYWGYPVTSAALTVLRKTPHLWQLFTKEEQSRLDDIMHCFAIECAWATNDCNDFWTGPELRGNYRKGWNPNHRSPGVLPIMFATIYFDSVDKVNAMLTDFDYDAFVAHLTEIGFTSALATVTTAGKTLMEEGGECFLLKDHEPAGRGAGIKHPYVYRGIPLCDTQALFSEILLQNCQGGKVVDCVGDKESGICGYLMNGTSPVLGLEGMMTEFTSHDASGIRSDITYCASNFCILVPALAAMVALGAWDPQAPENQLASERTTISNIDFLYKIENGYYSFSHGKGRVSGEKSTHGVYPFAKDLWKCMLS
ncbi:MAG: hypothetical protein J6R42_05090 [Clostridia bacterium]|nr:hypothetical protein [Clostridia bacterium]